MATEVRLISLQWANWRSWRFISPFSSSKGPAVQSRQRGQRTAADGLKQHLQCGRGNSLNPPRSLYRLSHKMVNWLISPPFWKATFTPLPKQSNSSPAEMRLGPHNDGGFDPAESPCLRLTSCIYGPCLAATIWQQFISKLLFCFFFLSYILIVR